MILRTPKQKRRPPTHNRRHLIGILLLILLFLSLPIGIFLIPRQTSQGGLLSSGNSTPTSPLTPSSTFVPGNFAANIDFESMNSHGTYRPAALANPAKCMQSLYEAECIVRCLPS